LQINKPELTPEQNVIRNIILDFGETEAREYLKDLYENTPIFDEIP
jgi:hypothetical protein